MKLKEGINDCTNAEYHGDPSWLSSSQLKLILESKERFYDEVILGNREHKSSGFFDEGSYTHSLILEPETIPDEYVQWSGWRKQGKEWEAVKEEYKDSGKIILSKPQVKRCEAYLKAFEANKAAKNLVAKGQAEHSICTILNDVQVKKRSDWINIEEGYIADVKTSAFGVDRDSFKLTIDKYQYDLSAALYCSISEKFYGKPFDFYFICISKSELDCRVFKMSKKTMDEGKQKMVQALSKYKECMETGIWKDERLSKKDILDDYIIEEV